MTIFCTPYQSSCTLPPQKSSKCHTLCMFRVLLLTHKSIKNFPISKLTQLLHHQLITLMSSTSLFWLELSPGTGLKNWVPAEPKHSRDYPTFPIHQTKPLKGFQVWKKISILMYFILSSYFDFKLCKISWKIYKSVVSIKLLQASDLISVCSTIRRDFIIKEFI